MKSFVPRKCRMNTIIGHNPPIFDGLSEYESPISSGAPSRKIRVVHVSLGLDVGGMEKLLTEFARHVDRGRFDLHFVALQKRGKLAAELESAGHRVSSLDKPPGLRPGLVWRLMKLLRKLRPDIVHTHNTIACFYAAPAARLARVPAIVHTRHGQRYGATRRQNLLFRLLSRFVDRIVCVSEDSGQLSIREGIDPQKVSTIRNGIDLVRFACRQPNHGGPAVLVARLSPEKDVETLLRATALVLRTWPDFRLNIVGDGVSRRKLEELAAQLELGDHVCFFGEVQGIPDLLSQAAMFVLPSLTEGISLTLLEAMAGGLPVVATAVGGNPEVVKDGETGLLVEPRSPKPLAEAISRLHTHPELARQMGAAGRRRAEECFDVRRMIGQYESLYCVLHARHHTPKRSFCCGKL
jgi:sugar transferase (PEP-CTERM/EpsH1 system associated)